MQTNKNTEVKSLQTQSEQIKNYRLGLETKNQCFAILQAVQPLLVTISLNGSFDILPNRSSTETTKNFNIVRGRQVMGVVKIQL